MSNLAIPDALIPLLTSNVVGIAATVRPDGSPATAHLWVDWDGEHLLFSSRTGARKSRNLRANPNVAMHLMDPASSVWMAIRGHVIETRPDVDLAFIDRLSMRYIGSTYPYRDFAREIFVVELDHVLSSAG